jgi:Skp family chaperone for outer membrane proteins
MRIFRLIAVTLFIAAVAALPTFAQQKQGAKPPTPSPTPAPVRVVSAVPTKLAFIITDAFKDEKVGIMRWVALERTLKAEFAGKAKELLDIETRIQALTKELDTLSKSTVVDRKTLVTKQEEIVRLQREQKFKKEDGEAQYNKRYNEVLGPVSADIGKALDAFAKQHGITLLLEATRLQEVGAIIVADPSTDVTAAFIADYNSKNPVPAGPGR